MKGSKIEPIQFFIAQSFEQQSLTGDCFFIPWQFCIVVIFLGISLSCEGILCADTKLKEIESMKKIIVIKDKSRLIMKYIIMQKTFLFYNFCKKKNLWKILGQPPSLEECFAGVGWFLQWWNLNYVCWYDAFFIFNKKAVKKNFTKVELPYLCHNSMANFNPVIYCE